MEGAEDILSELWCRLQDESLVSVDIRPYIARIIRGLGRVNDPQQTDFLLALHGVRRALERRHSGFASAQSTLSRVYNAHA